MAQRRQSVVPGAGVPAVTKTRRMSRVPKPPNYIQERAETQQIDEEPSAMVEQVSRQDQIDRERSIMAKYGRYLIQAPSEKCTVTFYHHIPNVTYREVVESIQAALLAAYRPTNSIVSVELVPLQARCAEYYSENRWIVEMAEEETASLLFRSDVYVRTRKVNVMSLSQALSLEKSREFRDQLRLRMQKANGPKAPAASQLLGQGGRRMSRVTKLVDYIEDPKTAVQLQSQQ